MDKVERAFIVILEVPTDIPLYDVTEYLTRSIRNFHRRDELSAFINIKGMWDKAKVELVETKGLIRTDSVMSSGSL